MDVTSRRVPLDGAELGQLIRLARTDAGLSQSDLAGALATTQSVVSRWERGHDVPRVDTLVRILRACGHEGELRIRPIDDGTSRSARSSGRS